MRGLWRRGVGDGRWEMGDGKGEIGEGYCYGKIHKGWRKMWRDEWEGKGRNEVYVLLRCAVAAKN